MNSLLFPSSFLSALLLPQVTISQENKNEKKKTKNHPSPVSSNLTLNGANFFSLSIYINNDFFLPYLILSNRNQNTFNIFLMDSLSNSSLPQKIQSNLNSSIVDLKNRLSAVQIPEPIKPRGGRRMSSAGGKTVITKKIVNGDAGYILEDVPHLADYLPDLPVSFCIYLFSFLMEGF